MKFFDIQNGQTFWLRGAACRKTSALTYVRLDQSSLGEIYIDPSDEPHISLTKEGVVVPQKKQAQIPAPLRGVHVYNAETGEEIGGGPQPTTPKPLTTDEVKALITTAVEEAVTAERARVAKKAAAQKKKASVKKAVAKKKATKTTVKGRGKR